jgi:zinc transporter
VDEGFLWAAAMMICSIGAAYLFMRRTGIFKK